MVAPVLTKVTRRLQYHRLRAWLHHQEAKHPLQAQTIGRVREQSLSYLEPEALWHLALAALEAEQTACEGIFLEAGCAHGGSALVLASSKSLQRPLRIYDVFGRIPAPSDQDGADTWRRFEDIVTGKAQGLGGNRYYGYEEDLYTKVEQTFAEFGYPTQTHNVQLIRGLYQDTLRLDTPVALAHIDCDWYDSVWVCLQQIVPRLALGGRLILDDYYAWEGCRKAVETYFCEQEPTHYRFLYQSRLHIVRVK